MLARGAIYWSVWSSIKHVVESATAPLNNQQLVVNFEGKFARFVGAKKCIAFQKARTAFAASLDAFGAVPGQSIILPPITIKAMLEVALARGLKPVFVDLDLDSCCFDQIEFERAVNHGAQYALVTPLFGIPFDARRLFEIANSADCKIIMDISQSLTTKFRDECLHTSSHVAIYSASSIKTLDTLGGGLATTNDESLAIKLNSIRGEFPTVKRLRIMRSAMRNLARNIVTSTPLVREMVICLVRVLSRKFPEQTLRQTGTRSKKIVQTLPESWFARYSSFQAGLGMKKLSHILVEDQKRVRLAREILQTLSNHTDFTYPKNLKVDGATFWQFPVYCSSPKSVQQRLWRSGIDSGSTSLSFLPSITDSLRTVGDMNLGGDSTVLPNAKHIYFRSIFVPCHLKMSRKSRQKLMRVLECTSLWNS